MSDDSVPAPAGPILVATDFSVPARHAAERAARLAHETVSPLVLLHVEPGDLLAWLDEWLGQDSDARHRLRHDHHQRLDTLADELHIVAGIIDDPAKLSLRWRGDHGA